MTNRVARSVGAQPAVTIHHNHDAALIERMRDTVARDGNCNVPRGDILWLMLLAGLGGTDAFHLITDDPNETIIMGSDVIKVMLRVAVHLVSYKGTSKNT
jgi:hypothetical protein